jgi:hypothetical protein
MIFESREVGLFNFRSGEFFAIKKFVKNQKLPRGPLITLSLSLFISCVELTPGVLGSGTSVVAGRAL